MTDEKDQEMSPDANEPQASEPVDNPSGEDAKADQPDSDAAGEASDSDSDDKAVEVMEDSADAGDKPAEGAAADDANVVNPDDASEDDAEAAMMAMLKELPDEGASASAEDINFGAPKVADAEFQQLSEPAGGSNQSNIDMLMDVDLPVAIELGRTEMTINDILALGPGSVVELNKLAGEPVDLLVNSKVVAKGEVVVVDENFGLRVTHLLTPEERLKCLAEA